MRNKVLGLSTFLVFITKTKMTALAKSIDLKGGWTDLNGKSMKIRGLANKSAFITPPY